MAKGIDIAIAADTRSAMSAINRGLIDPLEDVGELLETIGDDGKDATDKLERGMKDAQRRTDDAKDEIRDLRDELNKSGRAGKKAGDDIHDGMRRAEDGAEEFKDEANSTAREAAASFDGSAESIGDAFQEIAANAFAGFGPAGAVAGLAAAAGIGLVIAGFEKANEATEESKERANEWADAFIEAGGRVLDFETTMAKIRDITTGQFEEATKNAELWGVSVETAIAAMAGSDTALDSITASVEAQGEAAAIAAQKAQKLAEDNGGVLLTLTQEEQQAQAAKDALSLLTGEMDRGSAQASVYSQLLIDQARATEGAKESVDEFGDSIITLPDGKQIYIDAETQQATDNADAIEKKIYGIDDKTVNVNVTNSGLTAAQNDINRFVSRNNGRTIRLHGRFDIDSGAVLD